MTQVKVHQFTYTVGADFSVRKKDGSLETNETLRRKALVAYGQTIGARTEVFNNHTYMRVGAEVINIANGNVVTDGNITSMFFSAPKLKPHCPECGSDDVSSDATATYNADTQLWELADVLDGGGCRSCGYGELKNFDWK